MTGADADSENGAVMPRSRHHGVLGRELAISGAGLLALVVVGVVTWFVVHDTPRRAHAGDLVPGYISSTDPARSVAVQEPWGRVDVQVGLPVSSLPDDVTYEQGNIRPPDGGRFVAVQWSGTTDYDPRTAACAISGSWRLEAVDDSPGAPPDDERLRWTTTLT